MKTACAKCASGPTQIVGHPDLYVHSFLDATVIHRCRTCGRFWTRRSRDGITFDWMAAETVAGSLVP
jgi:hypothetical protein